mmetsp:Transcript_27350/g.68888  ORF Transcript_27350/g.68888 Transcript_27350/m.68888 type:complete len:374 (+) Transcript_27350:545-1666(+)
MNCRLPSSNFMMLACSKSLWPSTTGGFSEAIAPCTALHVPAQAAVAVVQGGQLTAVASTCAHKRLGGGTARDCHSCVRQQLRGVVHDTTQHGSKTVSTECCDFAEQLAYSISAWYCWKSICSSSACFFGSSSFNSFAWLILQVSGWETQQQGLTHSCSTSFISHISAAVARTSGYDSYQSARVSQKVHSCVGAIDMRLWNSASLIAIFRCISGSCSSSRSTTLPCRNSSIRPFPNTPSTFAPKPLAFSFRSFRSSSARSMILSVFAPNMRTTTGCSPDALTGVTFTSKLVIPPLTVVTSMLWSLRASQPGRSCLHICRAGSSAPSRGKSIADVGTLILATDSPIAAAGTQGWTPEVLHCWRALSTWPMGGGGE